MSVGSEVAAQGVTSRRTINRVSASPGASFCARSDRFQVLGIGPHAILDVIDSTARSSPAGRAVIPTLALLIGPDRSNAIHAAVMLNNDVTSIATFDVAFDRVPGVSRLPL